MSSPSFHPRGSFGVLAALLAILNGCNCQKKSTPVVTGNAGALATQRMVNFGAVPVGQKKQQPLSVSNKGAGELDLQSQAITADATGSFSEIADFATAIDVGSSSQAQLQFAPTQAGPLSAVFDLTSDGVPGSAQVQLTGVGVDIEITVAPAQVDFGQVQINVTPAPTQQVTFTNAGKSAATIAVDTSATLPVYTVSDSGGAVQKTNVQTLSPGASYAVTVAFEPTMLGTFSSSFAYTACQAGAACLSPQAVPVTGQGVNGSICLSPSPIGFTNIPMGGTATATVTATNCGGTPVNVSCVYLDSQKTSPPCDQGDSVFAFSAFSLTAPTVASPQLLDAGASFTFTLTYTATGNAMGDSDQLDVDYAPVNAPAATATDQILGDQVLAPCSLTLTPAVLDFGTVTVGSPIVKSSVVANVGQQACTLTGIMLATSSDPSYTLDASTPSSLTIPAGTSANLTVDFNLNSSNTPNVRKGAVDFQSNDPNHPTGTLPLTASLNALSPYAGGWPKWHYDNNNSGQTTAETSANSGNVVWKYSGMTSAQSLTQNGNPQGWTTADNGCGFTYLQGPVVADDPSGNGVYYVYQMGLDGTLYAFSAAGGVLWKTMTSDPSTDPHPSTPAVVKSGNIWAFSGSDAYNKQQKTEAHLGALFYLAPTGSILFQEPYGKDAFDASPGVGPDGTLFQADDNAKPDGGSSGSGMYADDYSAIAFQASGNSVTRQAGVSFPLTHVSERFGVAIGDDDTSFWGNNGQYFSVTPPASGFTLSSAWPAAGVTIADNSADQNAIGPVFSDLALDPLNTNFVFAYSAWEDGSCSGGGYYGYGSCNGPYSVQGTIAALSITDGSVKWQQSLPAAPFPSTWTSLCSDYGNAAPAVGLDGTVYVGNGDGLRAFDGATGTLKWLFKSANVAGAPAIGGDGTVFFGCSDGTFYAVAGSTGTQKFSIPAGAPISNGPAIADDGTVFFVSDDGTLWAVK